MYAVADKKEELACYLSLPQKQEELPDERMNKFV
jgi:hypothetical protein